MNKIVTNRVELSEKAYINNINFFSSILPQSVEKSVVIKANAYGHGVIEIASIARKCGIKRFCVHSLQEALQLRENGFKEKIVVLGPIMLHAVEEAVKNDIIMAIYNPESLEKTNEASIKLNKKGIIHLKLETGTFRQGIMPENLDSFIQKAVEYKTIEIEGVYTHFANVEDTTDHSYARFQMDNFMKMYSQIEKYGIKPIRHMASSAAAMIFPEARFEMVRIGIAQYGLWPSKESYLSWMLENPEKKNLELMPVLSWKTIIGQIKTIPAGSFLGYGCSYQTTRESKIAILPIGYSDGYKRSLSNQGYVLVKGKRAPIRGRIAMNLTTIDVTDIPDVKLEDEVILIGKSGDQEITAEQLASLMGTINYEVVTNIAPWIERITI